MTRQRKIAVCIPTYNQSAYVALAVESALAQNGVDTEVWVADDASTDATGDALLKFAANPRVHLHRQPENRGIVYNAAWVMSQPETDFIVRLDSDDLLQPDYCSSLSSLLDANPSAAVAHCATREIDWRARPGRVRRLARKSGIRSSEQTLQEAVDGYKVTANICMFRMTALRSLPFIYSPGVDYVEDWDLYVRLADAGWGNVYSSRVLAHYRVWSDVGGLRARRRAAEISGITHLLTQTLPAAYSRRSWPIANLKHARRKFAVAQSAPLLAIDPNSSEFARLKQLLTDLAGDSGKTVDECLERLRSRSPLGIAHSNFRGRVADLIKAIIYR